jgi:reactive intermediate/imine deaminase
MSRNFKVFLGLRWRGEQMQSNEKTGLTQVQTKNAPAPAGTYSQAIVANGLLFIAGQGPFDLQGIRDLGTFRHEMLLTLKNLEAIAESAGASIQSAVRFGVYLKDMANFKEMNEIFTEYLKPPYPARTTIPVNLNNFQIEIDAVIRMPD